MDTEITKAAVNTVAKNSDKALSKIVDLVFSQKILNQKRLETLSGTQDKKDAELIEKGLAEFRDGKFILIEESIGNPTSPLGLILANNNDQQASNLGKCLNKAYGHLIEKNDEQISDEQISGTFFNKWMNYGKEITEEELQDLWGKILSEEIATPNSINYLVLNTFSLMSKKHLEAFHSLLPFICDGNLYCNNTLSAEKNYSHVTPSILSELIDLNIIKGLHPADVFFKKELHQVTYGDKSIPSIYVNKTNFIAFHLSEDHQEIKPNFFLLTTIGQKLFEIALSNLEIENYFIQLINSFKQLPEFSSVQTFELVTLIEDKWQSKLTIQK
ncbi:DUF2806 domain-containing protein [Acinetobacter wuhouensis]|uniref:DUF2806 domain-containing protein n=1 Tax=Acinetobacter wuhouensis TaxID=1879050 RepID=A0A4V2DN84_9GAMM|nr:DUF2806 domain-containing protein [Acinetobacter wuhouensis]RZG47269.1 DUF2806 domain-containing protein [Acinetobacter wuhouensis]